MALPYNIANSIDALLIDATKRLGWDATIFQPEVRPADPAHGDYQANGVLGYAKRERKNPRELAGQLVAALQLPENTFDVSIAGPGFLNFKITSVALQNWLLAFSDEAHLRAGASAERAGQTWILDYSSPNTAKQMHVGHLRSAVIGEALARLLDFGGARVIRDNHIGDWGTQFGKLIWAYKRHLDSAALAKDALEEFERLYKVGNTASEKDEAVLNEARQELVKLQSGDGENIAIWKQINAASLTAFQQIYDRLGIRFDETLGESFYNDKVGQIYEELTRCELAREDQGALVVFHPEHPRFATQPFIVRKSDGAANYASTDLATILFRVSHFHANGVLYVVDKRQGDHFEQLFLTAKKWFALTGRTLPHLEHIDFGTVLGENGKPLKTRDGDNIRLKTLLEEATERAGKIVAEKSAELSQAEQQNIAEIVGVGSVQYADLSQNRTSDYVFAWDKMISLEGNTAAYLLYAVARIRSIFRKTGEQPESVGAGASTIETASERALARKLAAFPSAARQASSSLRPHFLCTYLYELAGEFSAFYTADKVIVDDPCIRARRLLLCSRTLLVLETGLKLLGLRTLQRM